MHRLALSTAAGFVLSTTALADEGMWLPEQIPDVAAELKDMGLALDPAVLADPQGPVLGAVVMFGGCSGAFVSPTGLIATNHHCVMRFLQQNSTGEQDLTRDGFTAMTQADELPAGAGAYVWILEADRDVTAEVLSGIRKSTQDIDRKDIVDGNRHRLITACEGDRKDRMCRVSAFDSGAHYRMQTYTQIQDLRLAYAPGGRVGDFGGDTDNWMWPRHAGDFALLRAWVAPDGSSVAPADDNVPYRPQHWLRVNADGIQEGDFVMVAGYPGRTSRTSTATTLAFAQDTTYPFRIAVQDDILAILHEESAQSDDARARLARPIATLENGSKLSRGMLDNFGRKDVLGQRKTQEEALRAWVSTDRKRAKVVLPALAELARIEAVKQGTWESETLVSWLVRGSDLLDVAMRGWRMASEARKPDAERDGGYHERDLERHQLHMVSVDQSLWLPVEKALLFYTLRKVLELEGAVAVPEVDAWVASHGSIDAAVEALMAAATADGGLASLDGREALLKADHQTLMTSTDPWIQLAIAVDTWQARIRARNEAFSGTVGRLAPLRLAALRDSGLGPRYYDANRTLRITTGHVAGYSPQDGLVAMPFTRAQGALAKVGPAPFDAPVDVVAALPTAAQSRWADPKLNDLPVDFLTTLDTTGGNSGSATLNAEGELIGLIFDGVWEAMSADWAFDPALTRSIHVDVRYLLWMLESVDGAPHLVKELLAAPPPPPLTAPASQAGEADAP